MHGNINTQIIPETTVVGGSIYYLQQNEAPKLICSPLLANSVNLIRMFLTEYFSRFDTFYKKICPKGVLHLLKTFEPLLQNLTADHAQCYFGIMLEIFLM